LPFTLKQLGSIPTITPLLGSIFTTIAILAVVSTLMLGAYNLLSARQVGSSLSRLQTITSTRHFTLSRLGLGRSAHSRVYGDIPASPGIFAKASTCNSAANARAPQLAALADPDQDYIEAVYVAVKGRS